MRFKLKPGIRYLYGMSQVEFKEEVRNLGWECEEIVCEEGRVFFLQKKGCATGIKVDEKDCITSKCLINENKFLHVGHLKCDPGELEGDICVKWVAGHMHPMLCTENGDLYDWPEFYDVAPFEGVRKLKAKSVMFERKFISPECIGVGCDTVPLEVWRKYTCKGAKQMCSLHKNLKFNCVYVKNPKVTACMLIQYMGEIEQTPEGFYEILDTGEMTMLRPGDVVIYNKDLLLHISTEQLAGFEFI